MLRIKYHKAVSNASSVQVHDRAATLRALAELALQQQVSAEVSVLQNLGEALELDLLVLPYPDAQTSPEDALYSTVVAQVAASRGKRLANLLTDVDKRFANVRTDTSCMLGIQYTDIWYAQASETAARAAFPEAVRDWPDAKWSYFPQTQLGFASSLSSAQAEHLPESWLYDCVYYGIHKQPRVARLKQYFDSSEFITACYGSQICKATAQHIDTERRLKVADVLAQLLPNAKFSLYVTCPGHYNSACFRLVEAAVAGRACLIDVASAQVGSFGMDECFFVQTPQDIAKHCTKSNAELAEMYKQYKQCLLSWCYDLPASTASLAPSVALRGCL